MTTQETADIVRAYYDAWTTRDFGHAAALLAPGLTVEVPVNEYPDAESFAAALRAAGFVGDVSSGYGRRLVINAPRERVFEAIATVDGPRHWWTTEVSGSADAGGELRFGFAGLDEQMVMRVSACQRPATVRWSCTEHTRDGEWAGTLLKFDLTTRGPRACELEFRHTGLPAEVVAEGWEHFLASLAAYAETGAGTPFGT